MLACKENAPYPETLGRQTSLHPPHSVQMVQISTGLVWLETVDCSSMYLAGHVEPV